MIHTMMMTSNLLILTRWFSFDPPKEGRILSEHRSICLNTLMGTEMTGFSHAYERIFLLGRRRIDTANAEIPCGWSDFTDDFL